MAIPSLLWCKNIYTDIIGEMIEYYVSYVLHQFRPLFVDKDLSCLRNRQSNSLFSFSGKLLPTQLLVYSLNTLINIRAHEGGLQNTIKTFGL